MKTQSHGRLSLLLLLLLTLPLLGQSVPDWCKALPRPEFTALPRLPAADPWFEVYRVRPGVDAIYEPHQSEEVISYLILGNRRALLFDSGLGIGDMARVVHALTPLPVTVVNSHTHDDHVGGNWQFDDVADLDTAFGHHNAAGSTADAQGELTPGSLCGALPAGFDAAKFATRAWRPHWIRAGTEFDLGGRKLELIATPGHTPDSVALFDPEANLAFTGDTLYPGEIYLYRPETNLDAYEASLRKIIALRPALILPAHNVPTLDPRFAVTVLNAMQQVRAGNVPGQKRDSVVIYNFPGFSFRLAR